MVCVQGGALIPLPGVDEDYDDAMEALNGIESQLQEHLQEQKKVCHPMHLHHSESAALYSIAAASLTAGANLESAHSSESNSLFTCKITCAD